MKKRKLILPGIVLVMSLASSSCSDPATQVINCADPSHTPQECPSCLLAPKQACGNPFVCATATSNGVVAMLAEIEARCMAKGCIDHTRSAHEIAARDMYNGTLIGSFVNRQGNVHFTTGGPVPYVYPMSNSSSGVAAYPCLDDNDRQVAWDAMINTLDDLHK
ncbi:MAG: hypothetical protein FWD28_10865 [Treponema sp.]|nr:hypothetical protein [Treponema sp.]